MYLISLYFDRETEDLLQRYTDRIAEKTGNFYMKDHKIPPHITIASCGKTVEEELIWKLERRVRTWRQGKVDWVSIGIFKPHVLFLAPVLNEYLHELCVSANEAIDKYGGKKERNLYRPFGWAPHTTIGRTLSDEQMRKGVQALQANFNPFSGRVVKAGLAESNPYRDIRVWELEP